MTASVEHSQASETVIAVVASAARAAAALVPATAELVPGAPVSDPDALRRGER
jgi:flagellar motor switch protein FliN/FliY